MQLLESITAPEPGVIASIMAAADDDFMTTTQTGPYNILLHLRRIKRLLTVKELAEILGKSNHTVYRMAQRRQIPCLMLAGTRCFDPSTIEAWLVKKEPQLAVVARQLEAQRNAPVA